jgi:hypothetical protein
VIENLGTFEGPLEGWKLYPFEEKVSRGPRVHGQGATGSNQTFQECASEMATTAFILYFYMMIILVER